MFHSHFQVFVLVQRDFPKKNMNRLILLTTVISSAYVQSTAMAQQSVPQWAQRFLELTNEARAKNYLSPVCLNQ